MVILSQLETNARPSGSLYAHAFAGESAKLILDWFSPVDPSKNHQLARGLHQQGTGKWFIDGPQFTKWLEKPNSALWIYGIRKLSCVNLNWILNIGYSGRWKDDLIVSFTSFLPVLYGH